MWLKWIIPEGRIPKILALHPSAMKLGTVYWKGSVRAFQKYIWQTNKAALWWWVISITLESVFGKCVRAYYCTKHSGHESQWEVRGEGREEPGGSVETGADLILLQMSVQLPVIVMQQARQLVHLNLKEQTNRVTHKTSYESKKNTNQLWWAENSRISPDTGLTTVYKNKYITTPHEQR